MKPTRRLVLKGLGGATLALPVLESFPVRPARAAEPSASTFAIFMRQANGVAAAQSSPLSMQAEPERFWPREPGPLTPETLSGRALEELSEYRDRLLVVGNVNMQLFKYGDGHAQGALQGLTARPPTVENVADKSEAAGESIDHRIGAELNPSGRDSLYLYAGRSGGWLGGPCISYRGRGQKRAAFTSPPQAYGAFSGGAVPVDSERVKSVNDLVREQLRRLLAHPRLGAADKRRLDLHLGSVREVEVQLGCRLAEDQARALEKAPSYFSSTNGDEVLGTVKLYMDIAAMAVACGHTRSVAIQVGTGNDGFTAYRNPATGALMENFHFVSHRRRSHDSSGQVITGSDVLHHEVDRQFARTFKHLIDRLVAYQMPGGGTLLDQGVAAWYNDNGNGPAHSVRNVPWILAGGVQGALEQGQYILLPGNGPNHNKLLNTLATAVGVRKADGTPLDDFGDPSLPRGLLSELLTA